MRAHLDFETRSACDLKKSGAHLYAAHESTDVLCMAYRFDNGPVQLWTLGQKFPLALAKAIKKGATIIAHNAQFEHLIWNLCAVPKYGWPPLPIEAMDCTMIRAYAMGLPGTLQNASRAVGLKAEKDMKGHRIMLQLSQPREVCEETGKITWWLEKDSTPKMDIRAKFKHLYRYCIQDVIVECELDKRLLPLSESEKQLWFIDQKINARGVHCDVSTVKVALKVIELEKKRLNKKMSELTEGEVGTCNSHLGLKKWVNRHKMLNPNFDFVDPTQPFHFQCDSVDKTSVADMLEMEMVPANVKTVLKVRQEAAKNSTAKLKAMVAGADSKGRVRGCFQFLGAASTGRWSGRRIQLHNMPRPTIKQDKIEKIIAYLKYKDYSPQSAVKNISFYFGPPVPRLSDCLRGMLTAAPGKKLIAVDYSQVESRVLAWLAGQENKLALFRGHGKFYEAAAAEIYGIVINQVVEKQRQVGKVSELSCGFQGGVGAFQKMAKIHRVKVSDAEAERIKTAWRKANPCIVQYWYDLESAAIAATENPGQKFAVGPRERRVIWLRKGSFLFCRLPSGRPICYPYPKIEKKFMIQDPKTKRYRRYNPKTDAAIKEHAVEKTGLTYMGEENHVFVKKSGYGGLLCENITQATARDLLKEGIERFEKNKYPVVMHCHDEITAEVDKDFGSVEEASNLMCILPEWAKDLPIAAGGWQGQRYRK